MSMQPRLILFVLVVFLLATREGFAATGGPDAYGYTFSDSGESDGPLDEWIDISTTGQKVIASGDDVSSNASAPIGIGSSVQLGHPFTFYGETYHSLVPAVDGYLSTDLRESGADNTYDCPLPERPSHGQGGRIYVNHRNWTLNSGGGVYYQYFRESPHCHADCGVSIFSWVGLLPSGSSSGLGRTFQVLLFDSGDILIQQLVTLESQFGDDETIGIQNPRATSGLAYGCPTPVTNNAVSRVVLFELISPSIPTAIAGSKVVLDSGSNGGSVISSQTFTFKEPITLMGKDIVTGGSAGTLRYGPDFEDCSIVVDGALVNIFDARLFSSPNIAIHVINGGHLHLCDTSILGSGTHGIVVEPGSKLTMRRTVVSEPVPQSLSHIVLKKTATATLFKSLVSDSWANGISIVGSTPGTEPDLFMEKTAIVRNRGHGLSLAAFNAEFLQCSISDNLGFGIDSSKCQLSAHNCNITNNSSGGINQGTNGQLSLSHTVVAGNKSASTGNLNNFLSAAGSTISSLGSNLTDSTPSSLNAPGDRTNTDPKLTPLGGYGEKIGAASPRKTNHLMCQLPLHESPLIDASVTPHKVDLSGTDLRGFPRLANGDNSGGTSLDIGAVEAAPFITVTIAADQNNDPPGPNVSLREALHVADGERIVFSPSMNGQVINLSSSAGGQGSGLAASNALTFVDASSLTSGVTISGGNELTVPLIASASHLHGLTLRDGRRSAIRNFENTIVLSACQIIGNSQDSATNNQPYAYNGGGIFNGNIAYLTDCLFEGNACTTDLNLNAAGGAYASAQTSGSGTVEGPGVNYLVNCRFIDNTAAFSAGAVYIVGGRTTIIDRCSFVSNSATLDGGARISAVSEERSYIDVTRSSFIRNQALSGYGGLRFVGVLSANNDVTEKGSLSYCTFEGNSIADGSIAALFLSGIELAIEHCTITNNSATSLGALTIDNNTSVTIRNSILDGNLSFSGSTPSPSNLTLIGSGELISLGHNLTGDAIFDFDQTSDLTLTPPNLAPLTLNSVAVPTRHPLHRSPAIDGGTGDGFAIDARGFPGRQGSAVDIGAVETGTPVIVTTEVDEFGSSSGSQISLREALRDAREGGRITFDPASLPLEAVIDLRSSSSGQGTPLETDRNLVIDATMLPQGVTIRGPGSGLRCLTLPDGEQTLSTHGLSFSHGEAASNGSAIYKGFNTELTLTHAAVHDCFSSNNAGAVHANGGLLNLVNVTLADNASTSGGSALSARNGANLTLSHSTIFQNLITTNNFPGGGAIFLETGARLNCNHVVLSDNLNTVTNTEQNLKRFGITVVEDIERTFSDDSSLPGATQSRSIFLHPLQQAGGLALTCPPLTGSATVDSGYTLLVNGLTTDARGFARKYGPRVDIGAYELGSFLPNTTDPPTDLGNNNIDDYWEEYFGYIPNHPGVAISDNDGDGLSALAEYLSQTHPNEANSIPPPEALSYHYNPLSSNFEILFSSAPGIAYQIWYSPDLTPGSFQKIIDLFGTLNTSATQIEILPTTYGGGPKGFFQIRIP